MADRQEEPATEALDLIRDLVQHWDAGDIDHDYDAITNAFDSARDYVHRHGQLAGEHRHPRVPAPLDVEHVAETMHAQKLHPLGGACRLCREEARWFVGEYDRRMQIKAEYARLSNQPSTGPAQGGEQ